MYKKTIWYSVQDGGDGSAYPHFFESEALADADQEAEREVFGYGWGENCTGSITATSESPITFSDEVTNRETFIKNLLERCYTEELKQKAQEIIDTLPENN